MATKNAAGGFFKLALVLITIGTTTAAQAEWSCIDATGTTHISEKRIWTEICTNLETGEVPTLMEGLQKKPPFKSNPKVARQVMRDGKATLLNQLKDPDSAKFKAVFTSEDVATCGEFNAKNSMGGYVGYKRFIVFANTVVMEDADRFDFLWATACNGMYAGEIDQKRR